MVIYLFGKLKTGKLEKVLESKKSGTRTKSSSVFTEDAGVTVTAVEWNPNGRQLAACTNSGVVYFWE